MKNKWLTIKQLDNQLKEWKSVSHKYGRPRAGWIKTLRVALSMSAEQFAERLGLTRGRVNQLENAEIHDSVTLRTLKEAADALECELIYAIVPKANSSLEGIIKKRAEEISKERMARVAHSMSLEAQTVDADSLQFQKNELAKSLMENLNKKFWSESNEITSLAESIYKKIMQNEAIPIHKGWREIFIKKINAYLFNMQNNNEPYEANLLINLNDPKYINVLKNALIRLHLNNKKQTTQADPLQKLIENLQKKK